MGWGERGGEGVETYYVQIFEGKKETKMKRKQIVGVISVKIDLYLRRYINSPIVIATRTKNLNNRIRN